MKKTQDFTFYGLIILAIIMVIYKPATRTLFVDNEIYFIIPFGLFFLRRSLSNTIYKALFFKNKQYNQIVKDIIAFEEKYPDAKPKGTKSAKDKFKSIRL